MRRDRSPDRWRDRWGWARRGLANPIFTHKSPRQADRLTISASGLDHEGLLGDGEALLHSKMYNRFDFNNMQLIVPEGNL